MQRSLSRRIHRQLIRGKVKRWLKAKQLCLKYERSADRGNQGTLDNIIGTDNLKRISLKICLFNSLGSIWHMENTEVGNIIKTYELDSYVDQNYEIFSTMCMGEQINTLERYIKREYGRTLV